MSRRFPVPRTPLQVIAVLVGGLIAVAVVVEGLDALVGRDDPPPEVVAEAAHEVEAPDPEIRVDDDGTIVIDFGGYDQTRIRIEGGEADTAAIASCLETGLEQVLEEERAASGESGEGWMARIAAKRKFRNRFRGVERQCLSGGFSDRSSSAPPHPTPTPSPRDWRAPSSARRPTSASDDSTPRGRSPGGAENHPFPHKSLTNNSIRVTMG